MKIGVTESGDAALDYTWVTKASDVDIMILMTKNITDKFIREVLPFAHKTIIHATCTGYGGTRIESNVPKATTQLDQVRKLIAFGFPAKQIVVRIDPIIPTEKGLKYVESIVEYIQPDIKRFRISVMDNYPHVKERFKEAKIPELYQGNFQASDEEFKAVDHLLTRLKFRFDVTFESCAEPKLTKASVVGCVNNADIELLGLKPEGGRKKHQREGCLCGAGKIELLSSKHFHYCAYDNTPISPNTICSFGNCATCEYHKVYGCSNMCTYCYWNS